MVGNAYSLSYQAVNITTIYAAYGTFLAAWWSMKMASYRIKLIIGGICQLIGGIILSTAYWYPTSALMPCYYTAVIIMNIDFCVASIILLETALSDSMFTNAASEATQYEKRR